MSSRMAWPPRQLFLGVRVTLVLMAMANLWRPTLAAPSRSPDLSLNQTATREAVLGGTCFENTLADEAALNTMRTSVVKYNQKKSMYRDGKIIAVYVLDRPGHRSLAGCANACLLNWRLQDNGHPGDTECSTDIHCPMSAGIIISDRRCEAFMFNSDSSKCYLLSGEGTLRLQSSRKYWSGKIICQDMSSIDDWAGGVVSQTSPPPPPPPPPPSPPPPPPPPPPPYASLLEVGTLPFTSQAFELSTGVTTGLPVAFISACGSRRLDDASYYKIVRQVVGVSSLVGQTLSVDTCDMPGSTWDTYLFMLVCTSGMAECSCVANDDSCGLQSRVDVNLSSDREYYVIITSYSSYVQSGIVDLTFQQV